jgi:fucose 4-O-acetylase-like acetyltransferase
MTTADRRYDIDWLRVFATYLLFFFHVSKVFDVPPYYHIKNAELSVGLGYVTGLIHQWYMPLFFVLAGWSLHASLACRRPLEVLGERVKRIFVPFVFGCCTLCVGLGYVERVLMPHKDMTFLEFIPRFFTSLEYFTWGHLWFLIYLFTFTLLYFPLFVWLKNTRREPRTVHGALLYLPLAFLIPAQIVLRVRWPGMQNLYDDWGNFVYYSAFLILGYAVGRFPAIEDAIGREWKRAAAIGAATSALLVLIWTHSAWLDVVNHLLYGPGSTVMGYAASDVTYHFLYWPLSTVTGYSLVIGMLGFGRAFLNVTNRWRDYLAGSALPVYILHQGGIVFPGYLIINTSWSLPAKFLTLLPVAVCVTMATYHFLVRPFRAPRFLLGMKARRRQGAAAPHVALL